MSNSYFEPVNDYFGYKDHKLEDKDDEIFLSNSRLKSSSYVSSPNAGSYYKSKRNTNMFNDNDNDTLENDELQILKKRRNEIEARTLNSTQKSLNLLYETEEVGKATALELSKQREQLEKTSSQLDDINASLRFSQRHLNGLKSIFGGLKNYLSGNRDGNQSSLNNNINKSNKNKDFNWQDNTSSTYLNSNNNKMEQKLTSPIEIYDNHPISRIRNNASYHQRVQSQQNETNNHFEAKLEANLEEMCGNLSRLKGLAKDMSREIESQNELLDNMNYKIEDVDLKINKQNKDINKLLGKK